MFNLIHLRYTDVFYVRYSNEVRLWDSYRRHFTDSSWSAIMEPTRFESSYRIGLELLCVNEVSVMSTVWVCVQKSMFILRNIMFRKNLSFLNSATEVIFSNTYTHTHHHHHTTFSYSLYRHE